MYRRPTLLIRSLLGDGNPDDKEASEIVSKAGFPCDTFISDVDTPELFANLVEYVGLREIQEYVDDFNKYKSEVKHEWVKCPFYAPLPETVDRSKFISLASKALKYLDLVGKEGRSGAAVTRFKEDNPDLYDALTIWMAYIGFPTEISDKEFSELANRLCPN